MKLRTLAVVGAALIALAGCSSGGGNGSSGQPTPSSSPRNAQQTLLEAAKCMRSNGFPDWPDPVRNESGDWVWPDSAPDVQTPQACDALFRAGKGGGQRPTRRPRNAEEMTQLRKWAECIRSHGVPEWPDPDSDGYFTPPAQLFPLDSNQKVLDANNACGSLEPAAGIDIKPGVGPSKGAR